MMPCVSFKQHSPTSASATKRERATTVGHTSARMTTTWLLALPPKSGNPPDRPYTGYPGVQHLGWEVPDAEGLRQRLLAAGFEESTYPNHHPHRKRVYFYDADGNDWEFVEYLSDDPAERNDYALPG